MKDKTKEREGNQVEKRKKNNKKNEDMNGGSSVPCRQSRPRDSMQQCRKNVPKECTVVVTLERVRNMFCVFKSRCNILC